MKQKHQLVATDYFNPEESAQLHAVGVKADACWKVKRKFVLGRGYVTQPPVLIRLHQVPPRHEQYRNVHYLPAIKKPLEYEEK